MARQHLLLVAPANSYRTGAYLSAAGRLGIDVLLASEGDCSLVAHTHAGLHLNLHTDDAVARLLDVHARRPFAAVVATDDATVELACRVAEQIGVTHNPPLAARLSRRKDLARARLSSLQIAAPAHQCLELQCPQPEAQLQLDYPCVIKPLALSGSRGVIRVDDDEQLRRAMARIRAIVADEKPTDPEESTQVLAEAFIGGEEVALEGILHRGQLTQLALFDKPDPLEGPFFEETYYITPSRHSRLWQQRIFDAVAAACAAYGLREGPVHAELRLHEDRAWIMEVAARTIGGDCGQLLRFGTGHSLEELVLSYALGRSLRPEAEQGAAGVLMIPIPQAGVLRRVEGLLAARKVPNVEHIDISVREGYRLVPLPEGASYLGFIFARADTPEAVEKALRAAHAHLRFVVAPLLAMEALAPN